MLQKFLIPPFNNSLRQVTDNVRPQVHNSKTSQQAFLFCSFLNKDNRKILTAVEKLSCQDQFLWKELVLVISLMFRLPQVDAFSYPVSYIRNLNIISTLNNKLDTSNSLLCTVEKKSVKLTSFRHELLNSMRNPARLSLTPLFV